MRISTSTLYENSAARLSDLQSALVKAQQQIASGRRMMTPADDPVSAARAVEVGQAQANNTQLATNRQYAKDSLSQEENALQSVTSLLQDAKTLVVAAGNGAYDDSQRKFLATELKGRFDELMGLANSRDGTGNYIFAGYQTTAQPFAQSPTGASYTGDQGQRFMQVGISRQMALSDTGSAVFENIKTGNGNFLTSAAAANIGSGIVTTGSVANATLLTGHNYSVTFTSPTTYDVVDTTIGLPALSTGNAFVSGQAIVIDGLQFAVNGAPATGDVFDVAPSTTQSIFTTLNDLINLLNTSASGVAAKANLTNGLNTANGNIDLALDNVLTVRASVGSRLKELDSLDDAGADKDLQYASTLSQLQDLDYAKAISQFTQQQLALTAAQQTFVKISGLSLFNYL